MCTVSAIEEFGQRIILTTMFVDIVNSSAFFAAHDDEDVNDIFKASLTTLSDIVERNGGLVNQVLGDGLMALFGLRDFHEKHCLVACRTAAEMRDACRDVPVRIGIDFGEVIAERQMSATMRYRIVGQSVHRAAKLEKHAAPSDILVSGAIADALRNEARFEAATFDMEKSGIVGSAYRLLSLGAAENKDENPFGFVGREVELDALGAQFAKIRDGRPEITIIEADAGLGKSRLLKEFLCSLGDRHDAAILKLDFSPGDNSEQNEKALFRQIVAALSGRHPLIAKNLRSMLRQPLLRLGSEYLQDAPRSAATVAQDGAALRNAAFAVLEKALALLCDCQPVVLFVEDVHWADEESAVTLLSLAANFRGRRFGIFASTRTPAFSVLAQGSPVTVLRLRALAEGAQERLLQQYLGPSQTLAALKTELKNICDGSPLYLRQLLENLIHTGALSGTTGAYMCTREVSQIGLPLSLQNLLGQRLLSVSTEAQRLARQASIIGLTFDLATLKFLAGRDLSTKTSNFAELVRSGLIREISDFPEHRFGFAHALLQESIYKGILKREKQAYHLRLFHYVRRQRLNGFYERHIIQAALHAHQSGMRNESLAYNYVAGRRAMQKSHCSIAVRHFENALIALTASPADNAFRDKCHLALAIAYSVQGKHEESRRHLAAAQENPAVLSIQRRHVQSRIASQDILDLWIKGALEQGVQRGYEILRTVTLATDPYNFITISARIAGMLWDAGRYQESNNVLSPLFGTINDSNRYAFYGIFVSAAVMIHTLATHNFAELGDFRQARFHGNRTRAYIDDNPNILTKIYGLTGIGCTFIREKNYAGAVQTFGEAYKFSAFVKTSLYYPFIAAHLGFSLVKTGVHAEGMRLLDEAWAIASEQEAYGRQALYLQLRAAANLTLLKLDAAWQDATAGVLIGMKYGEMAHVAWCHYLCADIAFRQNRHSAADEHLSHAIRLAGNLAIQPLADVCNDLLTSLSRDTERIISL